MELEKRKSIRVGNKSVITRLFNKIDAARTDSDIDIETVITNFEKITKKQTFLEELCEKILELTNTENVENEIIESEEYSVTLETKIKHIRKFMQEIQPSSTSKSRTDESQFQSHSFNPDTPSFIPSTHAQQYESQQMYTSNSLHIAQPSMLSNFSRGSNDSHRLPKLTLPKFSCQILEWQTFWDSFESAVHLNTSLTNVQKFNYLKAQLEYEALQSIAGFALTNVNYDEAVNVLKERYGKTEKIVSTYLEALIEIPQPRNDIRSLRTFYDQIESYVRGLDALGESQQTYGKLLVPIILKKLPGEIRKNLRRVHGSSTWVLHELRSSILEEINIMDEGQDADVLRTIPTISSFTAGARSKSQQNQNNYVFQTLENRPCVFCHEIHSPTHCTKVKDISARIAIVQQDKLCFNCLGHHRSNECKSIYTCRNCMQRHHTSICNQTDKHASQVETIHEQDNQGYQISRPQLNRNKQSKPDSTPVNLINDTETLNTSILHSHYTESRASVLLKTAVAPVGYNNTFLDTNILFDEGAQRSFVTEDLARKLKLKTTGTEVLNLSTFGRGDKDTRHLKSATIYLLAESGHELPIKVLIVPQIARPLQNHLYKIENQYEYLCGLRLAHPITHEESFQISLLIGADFYWELFEDRIIRGKGPTAVKSKLGYLLSGSVTGNREQENRTSTASTLNALISNKTDEKNLANFSYLQAIDICSKPSDETDNNEFLKFLEKLSTEIRDDKYATVLPWNQDHSELTTNFVVAKRRTGETTRPIVKLLPSVVTNFKMNSKRKHRDISDSTNTEERPTRHARVRTIDSVPSNSRLEEDDTMD